MTTMLFQQYNINPTSMERLHYAALLNVFTMIILSVAAPQSSLPSGYHCRSTDLVQPLRRMGIVYEHWIS